MPCSNCLALTPPTHQSCSHTHTHFRPQGLYAIARRFYALFQWHETPENMKADGTVRPRGVRVCVRARGIRPPVCVHLCDASVCPPATDSPTPSLCGYGCLCVREPRGSLPRITKLSTAPTTLPPCPQVFGEVGWNWVSCVGPTTALVVMDSRSERTRQQIIRPETWGM